MAKFPTDRQLKPPSTQRRSDEWQRLGDVVLRLVAPAEGPPTPLRWNLMRRGEPGLRPVDDSRRGDRR